MKRSSQKEKSKTNEKQPETTPREEEDAEDRSSLSDILEELRGFRAETKKNFAEIKKDITKLKEDIGQLTLRVNAAEERIAENESCGTEMTKVLVHVLRKQKYLEEKCQDLESRSRRKNLRIYSVPEKSEGTNMVTFINKLLNETLGITGVHIERAHRATGNGGGRTDPTRPRSILVRFQTFMEKQRVLQAAWARKEIRLDDRRIFFDEDFTAQVFAERAKYRLVRKELQERKIKTRILYPAKLKMFVADGETRVFANPQAAAEGLQEFGIHMDCSKDPDLEAVLQAAGWQTPRTKSGKTGRPDDLSHSLKTLLRPSPQNTNKD
ncbi:hypothetical protein WMY93_015798 [Mugilogobius chulae]|uniref:L1 transposable element RRM domain-containing protein n=1 Tax=Mugilogobius chulae TaxID=88201 RepID=A0AAW0P1H4_9GOBI